jgi:FAD:protein FMN transferase
MPEPSIVTVARYAMATRFEIVLHGSNAIALRAAGEAALDEIERLEAQLSLYRATSEVSQINARASREPVRVEPSLFRLLQQAKSLSEETQGAFDITIAPLMRAWGLMGGKGNVPTAAELKKARAQVGMHVVELDPANFTISFSRPGVMLDFGAIGKGYAIEQAADILREAGIKSALIHGGTSTVYAIGAPPNAATWKIAIQHPDNEAPLLSGRADHPAEPPLAIVDLRDEALSVSAIWGKSFRIRRKTSGHIIDPRTGHPVQHAALAAVILPSATETDALSTALLTLGLPGHKAIQALRSRIRSLVLEPSKPGYKISAHKIVIGPHRKARRS